MRPWEASKFVKEGRRRRLVFLISGLISLIVSLLLYGHRSSSGHILVSLYLIMSSFSRLVRLLVLLSFPC
jgi:hypothetical protein